MIRITGLTTSTMVSNAHWPTMGNYIGMQGFNRIELWVTPDGYQYAMLGPATITQALLTVPGGAQNYGRSRFEL